MTLFRRTLLLAAVVVGLTTWLLTTDQDIQGFFYNKVVVPLLEHSSPEASGGNGDSTSSFHWNTAIASSSLVWRPCYPESRHTIECTRLLAPLNHSDPEAGHVDIALARIPSPLAGHRDYRGPVIVNPGGPGASGVDLIVQMGASFSTILGPQFDILSFDPRGVARSTPTVKFFATDFQRSLWSSDDPSHVGLVSGLGNTSSEGLARDWARAQVTGRLASQQRELLPYINTDQVARDMLTIIEAHGRETILYWGLSYGTTLGATFASLYPEKVERIVLDGVMDMESYFSDGDSIRSFSDADAAMGNFYALCHAAGPDKCAFYDSSPKQIQENLDALYTSVKKQPIPTFFQDTDGSDTYGLVDYNILRMAVFQSLAFPFASFKPLAQALADLTKAVESTANGTQIDFKHGEKIYKLFQHSRSTCSSCCKNATAKCSETTATPEQLSVIDSSMAFQCNDGDDLSGDLEVYKAEVNAALNASHWGDLWGSWRSRCLGWPALPKTHFRGPIGARTNHPILLVSNTADPLTPLWAAKRTSSWFPRSVLLTQHASGHCSVAAPSICTVMHIRKYFVGGTLPNPGTVCRILGSPFDEKESLLSGYHEEMQRYDEQAVLPPGSLGGIKEALWQLSKFGGTKGFRF